MYLGAGHFLTTDTSLPMVTFSRTGPRSYPKPDGRPSGPNMPTARRRPARGVDLSRFHRAKIAPLTPGRRGSLTWRGWQHGLCLISPGSWSWLTLTCGLPRPTGAFVRACRRRRGSTFAGADAILHAGDILDAGVLELMGELAPVYAVLGNNNDISLVGVLPISRVVELGGLQIGMVHDSGAATGRAIADAPPFPKRRRSRVRSQPRAYKRGGRPGSAPVQPRLANPAACPTSSHPGRTPNSRRRAGRAPHHPSRDS